MENKVLIGTIAAGVTAASVTVMEAVTLKAVFDSKKEVRELKRVVMEDSEKNLGKYQEIQNECKKINEKLLELKASMNTNK